MSEAERITEILVNEPDLAAAALLVAVFFSDEPVPVPKEDIHLLRHLERLGCVHEGLRTPLGSKVAIRLEATGLFGKRW